MNGVFVELFSLFMACAVSLLIGYGTAVFRHDRHLRQVIESVVRENKQAESEFEDAGEREAAVQINQLISLTLEEVCTRMGQRI